MYSHDKKQNEENNKESIAVIVLLDAKNNKVKRSSRTGV